jgi:CysZ protein
MKDIGKSIASELKKLIYLALWMIPLLILFIIPGINLFAPFIMGIFSAWMLALEYNDYPLGNHGYFFRDVKQVMGRNRGLALGFGSAIMLISFIPILNFLAMPVGVTGATALWVERIRERENLESKG